MTESSYQDGQAYEYPLLIGQLLKAGLVNAADQEILYRDRSRYTYRELERRIHRLANTLSGLGVGLGDKVAMFDYDSPRYLECFFAVPMMGAILQTVNWRLAPAQVAYTINHAKAKTIIVHEDFLDLLQAIRPSLTTVETYILISESGQEHQLEGFQGEYHQLLAAASDHYDFPELDENTTATTFYTTGTTGDPKGVHFSHRQLVLHTLSMSISLGCYDNIGRFRSSDVYMPLTPMFHVHAWGVPYVATMLGVKQIYPGKYEPPVLLDLIVREKVTFSHCVPTILQMLTTSPVVKELDLSHWKVIIGGSKLSLGLAKEAQSLGITVYTGYGMSETCPLITLSLPKPSMMDWDEDRKLDIVTKTGTPVPLVEIEVVDGQGQPLPHDGKTAGEVIFRAPWLTKSYVDSPEKSKELWKNGYLHSGDVGHIDEEGYLEVTDRIKDVIKTGGEWIASLDLENILSEHEAVLESAAIGIADAKWGERPLMLVVLKDHFKGKVEPEELLIFMQEAATKGTIPKYGVPDNIMFLEALPKTSVGKLNKKQMRLDYGKV